MASRVVLEGLDEFRRQLRALPENMQNEAGEIVITHAEDAKRQIETGYPEGPTGNLKRRVSVERNKSKLASSAIVRSRAPHAAIFEFGTKRRFTDRGANRGVMPKASDSEAFIPKAIRARRRMTQALVAMLERLGFRVEM